MARREVQFIYSIKYYFQQLILISPDKYYLSHLNQQNLHQSTHQINVNIIQTKIIDMQKDKEKNIKEYQNLKRDLHGLLKDFERNKQWADFSNWLHRLFQQVSKKRFQDLPQKVTLCKRLAQCLNPGLPAGVHTTVLKVYEVILKNFGNKTQLLPLIALGLFPFFEHSNYANKLTLIKLFEEHFVHESQSVQMIVGLTNAMLTGLNEGSQQFAKKIFIVFDKIAKNYGKIWVDGAVWVNILKSPKVRLAGFKYFMKMFKDRDRVSMNPSEQSEEKEFDKAIESKIESSNLKQQERIMLVSLHSYRSKQDQNTTRFPNFRTLIVNTLCVCLDDTDQMIKRSTLDLLINYLKINTKNFQKQQGIIILQKMLHLLQTKEYNLTNRVYKYLFDQPNAQGQFHIDFQKKSQQLEVLKEALQRLLSNKGEQKAEGILLILEIIITDHPSLTQFLLTKLSFNVFTFIRQFYIANIKQNGLTRGIQDFYLGVIAKNKKIFLLSIIRLITEAEAEEGSKVNKKSMNNIQNILQVLQFYFSKLQRLGSQIGFIKKIGNQEAENIENAEQQQYKNVRKIIIRELIAYIHHHSCAEKIICSILDISNQLKLQLLLINSDQDTLTPKEIDFIQQILAKQAKSSRKIIYAKLITLLPHKRKEQLLPYIEDSSLSIVCINILLGGDKISGQSNKLTVIESLRSKDSMKSSLKLSQSKSFTQVELIPLDKQEQKLLFKAIFKLLNCHLFQSRALQFIQRFRQFYIETFNLLINSVQPSEWLIYWKKVNGDVSGGIIRMIENLDSQNSYHKHLSQKWIIESQTIISKVIEPLYDLMKRRQRKMSIQQQQKLSDSRAWNIQANDKIFNLLKSVFRKTSPSFSKYFFLQRQKYLNTFIIYVFKCIQVNDFEIKTKSLQMLTFLLEQTRQSSEKFDMINLTLPNVLSILDSIIDAKCSFKQNYERDSKDVVMLSNIEIELLEYISRVIDNFNKLLKPQFRQKDELIRILRNSKIYEIILKGMQHTETSYIKNLYMDSSKQIAEMIAKLDQTKTEITHFVTKILGQLFIMLKNTDMNTIQDIIRSRNGNSGLKDSIVRRKKSYNETDEPEASVSFYKESVNQQQIKHNLNLQEKYGEIIQLWNAVKFYIQFSIKIQLKEIPILNLISLILQSFPFSYLKYTCAGCVDHKQSLDTLQQQISNQTGLKKQVLEIFEILWNKQNRQIIDFLIERGDPRILVHSCLDPTKVLETFNQNSIQKQVLKYIRNGKFNLPKNTLHYNLEMLTKQNQLFYFIYVYFLYFNLKSFKNKATNKFFQSFIQFLRALKSTSHIQSKLWLLEIIELISQRMMVSVKDINPQYWVRYKQDIQDITKQLLDQIICIINKSKNFTHKYEIKTGLFNIFNKEEKQTSLYDFIKIYPPSIFQCYQKYNENIKRISKNKEQSHRISQIREKKSNYELPRERLYARIREDDNIILQRQSKIDQYLFVYFLNRSDSQYTNYLGLVCLKTLIRIGNSLLINVYQKQAAKVHLIIKEIFMNLLPICENRETSNQYFNELIAQYLHTVLAHDSLRQQTIRMMRKNILDVFMANDFFKCTQKTLFYWKGVIDYCTSENYPDLLGELLSSQGLFQGIFTKKAESTRQKIKSFERVCFVIYSGRVDKYDNKLRTVLQSLNDVMKQDNPSPALLILILFCIRILFMRLSTISLNKLFRSVWPSLITLLIQIFKKDKANKNVNLQLAALKVIQLVHALQLEQFMFHKWMFVFDYFGLKIDPMGDIEDNMKTNEVLSPFVFKPYLTNALPNTRLRCKFLPEKSDISNEQFMKKRRLISEEELRQYSVLLMQYMMDLNEYRSQISKNDIQNLIEDDFISLDDYIFKIK